MKTILVFLLLSLAVFSLSANVVYSTSIGGNWTSPSTWVGGAVPTSLDDVVILGLVFVNNHVTCANLSIDQTGSIMNGAGINWTLTATQSFLNFGSCEDNATGSLAVYVGLHFAQGGVLNNYQVILNSTEPTTLYQDETAGPIACTYFQSWSGTAEYQMLSDLRFENCQVDLYSHTVHMSQNGNNYGISLNSGILYRANLDTEGLCGLALSNNCYLYAVTAEDIFLEGNVFYYLDNTFENLTIGEACTVNTWNNGSYNLYVYEDLICRGTIQNQTGNVYLRLFGDLYNYGTMNSSFCYFMDTGFQYVYQSPDAQPFTGNTWGKPSTVTSGFVSMLSSLRFQNMTVDMNNRPLLMFDDTHNYGISADGGMIYRTTLGTNGFSDLTMSNDAYLYETNCGDIITRGTVQTYGNVYFQNCVNMGILRAWWSVQYVYVYDDLINWGTITNDTDSNTYFRVAGNLFNYGTISCYQMALNGTGNQICLIQGSVSCPRFTIMSMMGPASWYFNDYLQSSGSDYKDVLPYNFGVWRVVSGTTERVVTLSGSLATPGIPQNVALSASGDSLLLSWDQVDNATYYRVFKATDPYGSYTAFPEKVYDHYLNDGIASTWIDPLDANACFKVTAGN